MANSFLPQPAAPHKRVGRPCGRPPKVTSSRPSIPVGDFAMTGRSRVTIRGRTLVFIRSPAVIRPRTGPHLGVSRRAGTSKVPARPEEFGNWGVSLAKMTQDGPRPRAVAQDTGRLSAPPRP